MPQAAKIVSASVAVRWWGAQTFLKRQKLSLLQTVSQRPPVLTNSLSQFVRTTSPKNGWHIAGTDSPLSKERKMVC